MTAPAAMTLAVISPHLDDAVLGCGDLLARHPGAVVVTAFAGRPVRYPDEPTSWDARAGFGAGDDVVAARRREDEAALAALGARPYWLELPDPQYGSKPARSELADALGAALDRLAPGVVAVPLGLFHDDHRLTADAALDAMGRLLDVAWLGYADAIYRRVPDLLDNRLAGLRATGFDLQPLASPGHAASDEKRRAVACYRSQVTALEQSWDGGVADAFAPEQYWRIAARAAGRGDDGDGA